MENKIKEINISLNGNIVEIINKIGKEKSFENNLIKILEKLLQLRIEDMNKKILLLHEEYLKDKARYTESNERSTNKNNDNFKEELKKLIKARESYTILFQDLQEFIQGNLNQNKFESHIKKYPNPVKRQSIII